MDRVADAEITAIDPGVDRKRLPRDQHLARAVDRPARLVGHVGLDRVALVLIGVNGLGDGRVDLDFHRAVRADLDLLVGDQFGLFVDRCGHQKGVGRGQPHDCQPGSQS